jgi:hypothetical protein
MNDMKINWIDILERAAWTFAEGFLVALPVAFEAGMDAIAVKAMLVGAAMAGLSALKTFAIDVIKQHKLAE